MVKVSNHVIEILSEMKTELELAREVIKATNHYVSLTDMAGPSAQRAKARVELRKKLGQYERLKKTRTDLTA